MTVYGQCCLAWFPKVCHHQLPMQLIATSSRTVHFASLVPVAHAHVFVCAQLNMNVVHVHVCVYNHGFLFFWSAKSWFYIRERCTCTCTCIVKDTSSLFLIFYIFVHTYTRTHSHIHRCWTAWDNSTKCLGRTERNALYSSSSLFSWHLCTFSCSTWHGIGLRFILLGPDSGAMLWQ